MAKKKTAHHPQVTTKQDPPQPEPTHHHTQNPKPTSAAMDDSSEKVQNLKSLNALLLKETHDRRQQVETLVQAKAGLESQLSKFSAEKKALEIEMGFKSDESFGLELEKSVLCCFVMAQMAEMVKEKAEIEKVKTSREVEVEGLKREVNGLLGSLENEKGKVSRVYWERDTVKGDFDVLSLEANELRVKVVEMEKRERCVEDEVDRLKVKCGVLVEEKCKKERVVERVMRERDVAERKRVELESVIEDLKREVGRIVREKNEIDREKTGHEVRVLELQKETEQLNKVGLKMRTEKEGLKKKVSVLEESVGEAKVKEAEMVREIRTLVEEKKEMEGSVERLNEEVKSQKAILDMVTEELENKEHRIKEISQKQSEAEKAKSKKDDKITELSRQVCEQKEVIVVLQNSCNEQEEKNAELVTEIARYNDAFELVKREKLDAQKTLAEQMKIVEDLKLVVSEMEKNLKETEDKLVKMRTELNVISKKSEGLESRLELLVEEKDIAQKSLSDAQKEIHDWKVKYESAGKCSKQALTMLKNTAAFLASQSEGKKEVIVKDKKLGEEVKPYAAELNAIQDAFRNNEKMVADLKQQLESLRSMAQAQKRKNFWTLVSSATTIIAAASVAYATKGR